jgi:molybdopterin converting factor subunit 1
MNPTSAKSGKRIKLRYFAVLRDQAGKSEDTVDTMAEDPAELYHQLCQDAVLTLGREHVRAAVNGEFVDWDTPLQCGDEVVFIPPVSGG